MAPKISFTSEPDGGKSQNRQPQTSVSATYRMQSPKWKSIAKISSSDIKCEELPCFEIGKKSPNKKNSKFISAEEITQIFASINNNQKKSTNKSKARNINRSKDERCFATYGGRYEPYTQSYNSPIWSNTAPYPSYMSAPSRPIWDDPYKPQSYGASYPYSQPSAPVDPQLPLKLPEIPKIQEWISHFQMQFVKYDRYHNGKISVENLPKFFEDIYLAMGQTYDPTQEELKVWLDRLAPPYGSRVVTTKEAEEIFLRGLGERSRKSKEEKGQETEESEEEEGDEVVEEEAIQPPKEKPKLSPKHRKMLADSAKRRAKVKQPPTDDEESEASEDEASKSPAGEAPPTE